MMGQKLARKDDGVNPIHRTFSVSAHQLHMLTPPVPPPPILFAKQARHQVVILIVLVT
jgi:hypothetical protein